MVAGGCSEFEWSYSHYVSPTVFLTAIITLIPPLYIYINTYIQEKMKTTSALFYAGLIFFLSIIIYYFALIFSWLFNCHSQRVVNILLATIYYLYVLQANFLGGILMTRLVYIFKDTEFSISTLVIWVYIILSITGSFLNVIGTTFVLFIEELYDIGILLWGFSSVMYISTVIWLNYLFVHKLYRVYRACRDDVSNCGKLVNVMTKASILCFISTMSSIAHLITLLVLKSGVFNGEEIGMVVLDMNALFDIHTSYLSILLSYKYFDGWYMRICGCCHQQCYRFWNNPVTKSKEEILPPQITMNHEMVYSDSNCQNQMGKADDDKILQTPKSDISSNDGMFV